MKRVLVALFGVLAFSVMPRSAAATDQEVFAKLFAKIPRYQDAFTNVKPKLPCACIGGGQFAAGTIGVVVLDVAANPVQAHCATPQFNADGSLSILNFICPNFEVLR